MRHLLRLAGSAAVSAALLAGTLGAPAHAGDTPRDELSAQWLAAQPTAGLVHNPNFGGFDDYGLTADVGLALAALGGQETVLAEIRDALAGKVDSYTTGMDWGSSDIYAGSTAKLVVFAQAAGADAASYGGVDLVQRLSRRVSTDRRIRGRIEDRTAGTDYANVIGQALAVQGLAEAGSPKAAPALRFLLRQQCANGYFRLGFTANKLRRNQTCDGGDHATTSAPDTDATAIAVLALRSLDSADPSVRDALRRAKSWLLARQKANGSFGGGTSTEASNTNSTGLAGWALGELRACRAAADAADWVSTWQVTGAPDGSPLAGELGAIAYNRGPFTAAQTDGITDATRDQWRRATAQAAPALRNLVLSDCRSR